MSFSAYFPVFTTIKQGPRGASGYNCTSYAQPSSRGHRVVVCAAGSVARVKAPDSSRALGKAQPHSAFVPVLFVQPFLERPAVFWSTKPQPSAKQAKHMTDVKQLFPEMSAKRPRSWRPFIFFSEARLVCHI